MKKIIAVLLCVFCMAGCSVPSGLLFDIKNAKDELASSQQDDASTPDGAGSEGGLHFDGIYYASAPDDNTWRYIFRFYEDGTVLNYSQMLSEGEFPDKSILDKNTADQNVRKTTYTLTGSTIKFTTTSRSGTVDYEGTIENGSMALRSHSNINGYEAALDCQFLSINDPRLGGGTGTAIPANPSKPKPVKPQKSKLRFDGIYCGMEPNDNAWKYIFRFYEDGTVLSYSHMTAQGQFPNKSILDKNTTNPNVRKTTYTLNGNKIRFTTTSKAGTVDYEGTVEGSTVTLHSHSNINGHEATLTYEFISMGDPKLGNGIGKVPPSNSSKPDTGNAPTIGKMGDIRYDGLYYACGENGKWNYIFRFYEDGTVLSHSQYISDGRFPKPGVMERGNKSVCQDTYTFSNNRIEFTTTSETGTVDYDGFVYENYMQLHSHSNINGYDVIRRYTFIPMDKVN